MKSMRQETFRFAMNKCSQCVGKAHCASCGEDLVELLSLVNGIERVEIDMKKRSMSVCYTFDESDLEDELEERGVFRL